jgi:hypothetical protein
MSRAGDHVAVILTQGQLPDLEGQNLSQEGLRQPLFFIPGRAACLSIQQVFTNNFLVLGVPKYTTLFYFIRLSASIVAQVSKYDYLTGITSRLLIASHTNIPEYVCFTQTMNVQ